MRLGKASCDLDEENGLGLTPVNGEEAIPKSNTQLPDNLIFGQPTVGPEIAKESEVGLR